MAKYSANYLGSPELLIDGREIVFPFLKARILAMLIIEERCMSRERICSLLWNDKTIENGRRNLSNALSCIRNVIPVTAGPRDVISIDPDVQINRDTDALALVPAMDWDDMRHLFNPYMDIAELEEWPGFSQWLIPKRRNYHNLLIANLCIWAERELELDTAETTAAAIKCYEQIAEREPYDEKIHGELVRLYIKTGQKVKAVCTARTFAGRIKEDLGIDSDIPHTPHLIKRNPASSNDTDSLQDHESYDTLSPTTVHVESLDRDARIFLEIMAVSESPVSMMQVSDALDIPPIKVADLYDSLRLQGFLNERQDGGDVLYLFTNMKIKEALLDGMSLTRKKALHRKCAEILESGGRAPDRAFYDQMVHHCRKSGCDTDEIKWRAEGLKLHFQATHEVFPALADSGILKHIPAPEDMWYTDTAMSGMRACLDEAIRHRGRTAEISGFESDWHIIRGGYLWWKGDYSDSRQILTEVLRREIHAPNPTRAIEACAQLCYLAIQTDDTALLKPCAKAIYRMASQTHMHRWMGVSLRFIAIACILQGHPAEAMRLLQMSTRIFEKLEENGPSYTVSIIAAEHFRGDLRMSLKDVDGALHYYMNCVKMGESLGLYRGLGLSLAKAGYCHILQGNFTLAENMLRRTEAFYNLTHSDWGGGLQGGGIAFSLMALMDSFKGDWERCRAHFATAQKLVRQTGRPTWKGILYWAKSEMCLKATHIPGDVASEILNKGQDWYQNKADQMKSKVLWLQ